MGCLISKNISTQDDSIEPYYWYSKDDCCICMEKKCNILLLPCNHLIICDQCCKRNILNDYRICPTCQQNIYSYNLLQIIPTAPNDDYL